jgi:hypothetical protein
MGGEDTWGSTSVTQKFDPHVASSPSWPAGVRFKVGRVGDFNVDCLEACFGDIPLGEEVDGWRAMAGADADGGGVREEGSCCFAGILVLTVSGMRCMQMHRVSLRGYWSKGT